MSRKVFLKANWFLALVIGLISIWGCSGTEANNTSPISGSQEFVIAGSGSNLPVTGKLIEGFQQFNEAKNDGKKPENIEMPSSIGSSGAVKAVSEGAITLGLTSRPLKDNEITMGLKQVPYARIGVVIGVNQNVQENSITSQELVDIFMGTTDQWKSGDMIVVLSREKGDSSNQSMEKHIPGFKAALEDSFKNKRWQIYYTDQEEAQGIVSTPFSLGFTDTSALAVQKLKIKPLMLDGVKPDLQNLADDKYPLHKELYFVYKDPLPDKAKRFLEFVSSDEGARIILANGAIPMKGK